MHTQANSVQYENGVKNTGWKEKVCTEGEAGGLVWGDRRWARVVKIYCQKYKNGVYSIWKMDKAE